VRNRFRRKPRASSASDDEAEAAPGESTAVEHRRPRRFVDRLQGVSVLRSDDGADFVLVNLDAVQAELDAFPVDPGQLAEHEREAVVRTAINNPANWMHDPSNAPDARYGAFEVDRRLAQIKFSGE
jgi:hypothetical protein